MVSQLGGWFFGTGSDGQQAANVKVHEDADTPQGYCKVGSSRVSLRVQFHEALKSHRYDGEKDPDAIAASMSKYLEGVFCRATPVEPEAEPELPEAAKRVSIEQVLRREVPPLPKVYQDVDIASAAAAAASLLPGGRRRRLQGMKTASVTLDGSHEGRAAASE